MSWRTACAVLVVGMGLAGAASAQQLNFELIGGGAFGDNGAALQANLADATDIAYDAAGNLYVSQRNANRIRRIAPNGTITTIAGGNTGFAGDGGQASAALISRPAGLAFDSAGNLYFADSGNRRIRKITPAGVISTIAGNGGRGHAGDGGSALSASFATVNGLAVDAAGNVFVSDTPAQRVRRITPAGLISTVAGTGDPAYTGDNGPGTSASLNTPSGLDTDAAGNLYIADSLNQAIRRVTPAGVISTVWRVAQRFPTNVKAQGNALYISDATNCAVYLHNLGNSSVVAGGACGVPNEGGTATTSRLGGPDGVAVDPLGQVVFVDTDFSRVRRVTNGGLLQTIAGVGGSFVNGRAAIGAPLGNGYGLAVDAAGNVTFSDTGYTRVRRINATGTIDTLAGMDGVWLGEQGCADNATSCPGATLLLGGPSGIALGTAAGEVVFTDRVSDLIFSRNAAGTVTELAGGGGLAVGADGPANQVRIDPYGIARAPNGDLYFTDYRANKVRRLNAGNVTTYVGMGDATSAGDGGYAWFASVNRPMAIAIDPAGAVYVSEGDGRRVRRVAPDGKIATFAGNGQLGVTGNGVAATSAAVGVVTGIAVAGSDVYLASEGLLRRVRNGIITTVPFTQFAMGLSVGNGKLYVTTQQGGVYVAALPRAVASDYDGDGRSDILWRNGTDGANTIWKGANNATQQATTGVSNLAWKIVGQGDFDGDGRDDIVWRNSQTGQNSIWRAGNAASLLPTTSVTNLAWQIVGVGDFNKDGKADLVWRNKSTGDNTIWTTPTATLMPMTKVPDQRWQVAGVGDFNHDGASDVLWRNSATGQNRLWSAGNSAKLLPVADVTQLAYKVGAVGDFDGDGRADILWRHSGTGQNIVWNGGNIAQNRALTTVSQQSFKIVAVGDYDGNGKADLLWRNGANGVNTIWKGAVATDQFEVVDVTSLAWSVQPYEFQP